MYKYCSYYKCL